MNPFFARRAVLAALLIAVPACGGGSGDDAVAEPPGFVWTSQNPQNVAIVTAADSQGLPRIASDGNGGAVIVWADRRDGTSQIYARRVSSDGTALWTADGVALTAGADGRLPRVAADGSGGAIVAWEDARGGTLDVYAQRLDAAGVPQWAANGVLLCGAAGNQNSCALVSDAAGGAIVLWSDGRGATTDIYAQRVDAAGAPQWAAGGVVVCGAAGDQGLVVPVEDGASGVIAAWTDSRNSPVTEIYAQRLNGSGAPQWTADGVLLGADTVFPAAVTADGAGGAIVAWSRILPFAPGAPNYDLHAQRLNAVGTALWTPGGVVVCGAIDTQTFPDLVSDGAGGAFVAWSDYRSDIDNDIYAQRLNAAGAPQWTADGVPVCIMAGNQVDVRVSRDGAGGMLLAWEDHRSITDVYAQRLSASGVPRWALNGAAVSTAASSQGAPRLVSDGAGGMIVTWEDQRGGTKDVYAQGVGPGGPP